MRNVLAMMVLVGSSVVAPAFAQEPDTQTANCASASAVNPYFDTSVMPNPYTLLGDSAEAMVEPNPYRIDATPIVGMPSATLDGCAVAMAGADNPYLEDVAIEDNPYVLAWSTSVDSATEPNPYY